MSATYAVLDDNTREANVIGHATDAKTAQAVWLDYYRQRMDGDDFATLTAPTFALRHVETAISPTPAFEPI